MARPIRKPAGKALFSQEGSGTATLEREGRSGEELEREGRFGEEAERQLRELLEALEAVRKGDLTRKLKKEREDVFGELASWEVRQR